MSDASVTDSLAAILRGGLPKTWHEEAADLFRHEIFEPRPDTGLAAGCALAYQRVRKVADLLPPGTNLALQPDRLFPLISAAAVVDPAMAVILVIHHGLALSFLEDLASDSEELRRVKDDLIAVRAIGQLLVTELGNGNSQLQVRTTVTYDPDSRGFVLHTPDAGAQKFMGNHSMPGLTRHAVVNARLVVGGVDRGAFPFLVTLENADGLREGVEIRTVPADVVPLDYALARFHHVRLPYSAWLSDGATIGEDGEFADPHSGDRRIVRSLSAVQNVWAGMTGGLAAVTRTSVSTALRLSAQRTTLARVGTARPMMDYLSQQRPLFSCAATAFALSCRAADAQQERVELVDAWRRGRPADFTQRGTMTWAPWADLNRSLSVTKAMAAWATEAATAECRLRCGVLGTLTASRLPAYQGLGHMLNAGGGDNLLIILDAARALVAEYSQGGAAGTASSAGAAGPADTADPDNVADPQLAATLLAVRQDMLCRRIAAAVRSAGQAGADDFETWNGQMPTLRELGETYGRRLILDSALAAAAEAAGQPCAALVRDLVSFHALEEISRHAAWFLVHGLLTVGQVAAIDPALDELCRRLAPRVPELISAFGELAPLARSVLATDDYVRSVAETVPQYFLPDPLIGAQPAARR